MPRVLLILTMLVLFGAQASEAWAGRFVTFTRSSKGQTGNRSTALLVQVDVGNERWSMAWEQYRNTVFANVLNRVTGKQDALYCRGSTRPYQGPFDFESWLSGNEAMRCFAATGRGSLSNLRPPTVSAAAGYWVDVGEIQLPKILFAPPQTITAPDRLPMSFDRGHFSVPVPIAAVPFSEMDAPGFYLVQFPVERQFQRLDGGIEDRGTEYYSLVWDTSSGTAYGTVYDENGDSPEFIFCAPGLANSPEGPTFDQQFFNRETTAFCERTTSVTRFQVPRNDVDAIIPFWSDSDDLDRYALQPFVMAPTDEAKRLLITYYEQRPGFGPGTHCVSSRCTGFSKIEPGSYRANDARDGCYWERLDSSNGIIDNDFIGRVVTPPVVRIRSGDFAFHADVDCGRWEKID